MLVKDLGGKFRPSVRLTFITRISGKNSDARSASPSLLNDIRNHIRFMRVVEGSNWEFEFVGQTHKTCKINRLVDVYVDLVIDSSEIPV